MQKHILLAENAPTTHTFYRPTINTNSQHPYLTVTSFLTSIFYYTSRILERIPNIQDNLRDSLVIQHFLLGIKPNNQEIHF